MDEAGWLRLGRRIQAERGRRGFRSSAELAQAAGLSRRTVAGIESGTYARPRAATLAKIEQALGWQEGSCLRVLEGGRPRPVADPLLERLLAVWLQLSGEDQVAVVEMAERRTR